MKKFIAAFGVSMAMAWADGPTDLDSLFQDQEYKPVLSESLRDSSSGNSIAAAAPKPAAGKKDGKDGGLYVLQFEAVADFDAAQRRRAQLAVSTGFTIDVVFEAPFYKLRGGGWSTKKAAEDKARELSAYNVNAFVVKVK